MTHRSNDGPRLPGYLYQGSAWGLIGILFLGWGSAIRADEPEQIRRLKDEVVALTDSLRAFQGQRQRGSTVGQDRQLAVMLQLARERRARMVALAHEDPASCVRFALTAEEHDALPVEIQAETETNVTAQGILEVDVKDFRDRAEYRYVLRSSDGQRFSLHLASSPRVSLLS